MTPGYAGRASRAVAPPWFHDPFAGGRGRERRPRTVGPEHHVGPSSLGGPNRGRRGGGSVDHLQPYSATLGPQSQGARPCLPESDQRPRQWGNQDGASCHAHNLSESNNRPLPGAAPIVASHCGSPPLPGVLSMTTPDTPNPLADPSASATASAKCAGPSQHPGLSRRAPHRRAAPANPGPIRSGSDQARGVRCGWRGLAPALQPLPSQGGTTNTTGSNTAGCSKTAYCMLSQHVS